MTIPSQKINYAFFGSAEMSIYVLDEMKKAGCMPALVITTPDKPKGRTLVMSGTPVKVWAQENNIPVLDPDRLDEIFIKNLQKIAAEKSISLFIVAAYGKIIPQAVLDIPANKTLNIHPSLLPLYRGAAPLQSAILDDMKNTGVTVMRIDAEMDHGPIVAQKKITVAEWPTYEVFEENMARKGAQLLVSIMSDWVSGKIKEREQDHSQATFTRKFKKEDGLIDMSQIGVDGYAIFRKIQAFHLWPTTYFFADKKTGGNISRKIRVKITDAEWKNGKLIIKKVIPEGKPETDYELFLRSLD